MQEDEADLHFGQNGGQILLGGIHVRGGGVVFKLQVRSGGHGGGQLHVGRGVGRLGRGLLLGAAREEADGKNEHKNEGKDSLHVHFLHILSIFRSAKI